MHISDGIIDTGICIGAGVLSLGLIYLTGRKAEAEEIPKMGITAAALFVASLIHIPIAGTSLHPGLYGIAGIILGKHAFPVIFSVILFQALIFQHGGLLTVGVNALNMGAGAYVALLIWNQRYIAEYIRAFLAGLAGVLVPATLMAIEFMLSDYGKGILAILSVYSIVALTEGLLALGIVKFFRKVKSDIIK